MLRRRAISCLLSAAGSIDAKDSGGLDSVLDPKRGCAILLDIQTRRVVTNGTALAGGTLLPPGSAIKPLVLAALLRRGKLKSDTSFPCPGRLTIGNRRFDCTHPPLAMAVRPDTALAYSCNCFVAHVAEKFEPGELSQELESIGLASPTGLAGRDEASGRVTRAMTLDSTRMQAIGESGVLVTPLELALAYRQLARDAESSGMQPILTGMEGAVEFGTAQRARMPWATLAGKTGSTRSPAGDFIAWFAGFLPSRAPATVVVVMLSGHSGGADAAPVAAQILEAHRAGRV